MPVSHFLFLYTPGQDRTLEVIQRRAPDALVIEATQAGHRGWSQEARINQMVELRNRMLKWARHLMSATGAHLFLSLDSDILWDKDAPLEDLVNNLHTNDAVSPLVYLGRGSITNVFVGPSPARTGLTRRARPEGPKQGTASVLCAAILMNRRLVLDADVKYGFDRRGEDFHWSFEAWRNGYDLGYNFNVQCKHIMFPEGLDQVDRRLGW